MLDEYVGGRMALTPASPATLTQNNDLRYMILNKKHDKVILITISGKTGEITSITEQEAKLEKPRGKIIQFRQYKKEE